MSLQRKLPEDEIVGLLLVDLLLFHLFSSEKKDRHAVTFSAR